MEHLEPRRNVDAQRLRLGQRVAAHQRVGDVRLGELFKRILGVAGMIQVGKRRQVGADGVPSTEIRTTPAWPGLGEMISSLP